MKNYKIMNTIFPCLVFTTVLFAAAPLTVQAQGPGGSEPGFSGRLQAGALFLQTDSQLSAEDDNERMDDLGGPADTYDETIGLASVYLRYEFEGGTAIYAGNPLEVGQGFEIAAGVSRPIADSTLDVALTWLPISEVWKNPYQTGTPRDETDVEAYGLKVEWQEAAGSPWEFTYEIDRIDIEDDEIGDLVDDLKRDGWVHELGARYSLPLGPGINLRPELSFAYGDIEGGSNRYYGIESAVLLQRVRPPWMLLGRLSVSHDWYDKRHPLFDKTRREFGASAFAQVMRMNLFGRETLFASLGAGYVLSEANIDFFDSRTVIALASVGINF